MSQDLFAAFGDPLPPAHNATPSNDLGDDDWGDFEDASTGTNMETSADDQQAPQPSSSSSRVPPKPPTGDKLPSSDSKVGKHPFAGHMDFLFEPGEDEYDAGADDLENLATNPEAAMAYSKRIIAEQEARAERERPLTSGEDLTPDLKPGRSGPRAGSSAKADHESSYSRALIKSQFEMEHKSQSSQPPSYPSVTPNKLRKKSGYAPTRDPNVLFDAENVSESEEDEYGDFEGDTSARTTNSSSPGTQAKQSIPMPAIDLLGLNDTPKTFEVTFDDKSASVDIIGATRVQKDRTLTEFQASKTPGPEDNPWEDFEPEIPVQIKAPLSTLRSKAIPAADESQDDASWADFDDVEPLTVVPDPAPSASTHSSPPDITSSTNQPRSTAPISHQQAVPPTNIPPPVVVLSLFPSIFSSAQDTLFGPLSKLDGPQRQQLLSHAATHQFLYGYLDQATVLAHVIAGRKLRWKRDQILAQSMRIGPAAAGGKGGMKLTGIDRSEMAKEEREVLDVIRLWKAQVGKLRGAVAGASNSKKLSPVPDISELMPVKVLKVVEGGFVAPHPCALCGLRREERVAKVDLDIDDSFGEWWANGIDMHLTCRTWWEGNRKRLQSR